jgi:hypothetical protein
MKSIFRLIAGFLSGLLLFVSVLSAAEPVPVEAAGRSAEYHAEKIFKRDLRIIDRELMTWPWGEPAVYVFTLTGAGDDESSPAQLEPSFLQGAYLVSLGREEEGYRLMARPDRYVTVYTGATDDMPSMLKAHAGLPEHVLALATMDNPPADPAWIYGGLFHVLLASKARLAYAGGRAVEIHTRREYRLKDLGRDKAGAIAPQAAGSEWAPFWNPGFEAAAVTAAPAFEIEGLEEGEHKLPVEEANLKSAWKGCSPAAFYNCLKYLESKGKVGTQGKAPAILMDWIAICYHTDPNDDWATTASWIINGSALMFRGLGYNSTIGEFKRVGSQPGAFLIKFAAEIESGYPCNLGGSGKGVFEGHSTTGIGYLKAGPLAQLIIHDGWNTTPDVPVYVKYMGYPAADLEYPAYMRSFHPGGKRAYPEADPEVLVPPTSRCNPTVDQWKYTAKLTSFNAVTVEAYAYEVYFYDVRGAKYSQTKLTRVHPFYASEINTYSKPRRKAGRVDTTYFLVDSNGHLLKAKSKVKLVEAPVGKFLCVFDWAGIDDKWPATWRFFEDGTLTDQYGGRGTWTINRTNFKLVYATGTGAVYIGTINKAADRMTGTMSDRTKRGTWAATRTGAVPSPPGRPLAVGETKADGSRAGGKD